MNYTQNMGTSKPNNARKTHHTDNTETERKYLGADVIYQSKEDFNNAVKLSLSSSMSLRQFQLQSVLYVIRKMQREGVTNIMDLNK